MTPGHPKSKLLGLALGSAILLGLAACGGSTDAGASVANSAGTATVHHHIEKVKYRPIPAKIVPAGWSGTEPSDSIMTPVINEWVAADSKHYTIVYAGKGSPVTNPRGMGLFVIERQNRLTQQSRSSLVRVPHAGALRITKAPEGRAVVTWAQKTGRLRFRSKQGTSGVLKLADDSVKLVP